VVLTAKASEPERVAGLRAGADDYLVKPFSLRELIARVEAVYAAPDTPASASPRPTGAGRCSWTPSGVRLPSVAGRWR